MPSGDRCFIVNASQITPDEEEIGVKRSRIVVGLSLLVLAGAAYLLGFTTLVGVVGSGTVTLYPSAALGLLGALTLWVELRQA